MSQQAGVDELDADRIGALLRTERVGRSLDVRALTGSTSDDARDAAEAGAPSGHVVLADAQTLGRGSRGRGWSSPAGVDLYLSIVERTVWTPADLALVTLAVGLGVTDAIRALAPEVRDEDVRLKWPNDAWMFGRKTAGILVESSSSGARRGPLVIGIGLGVNRLAFPPELELEATSVLLARRRPVPEAAPFDRASVLATLLLHVERALDALARDGARATVDRLRARLALVGEPVRVDDVEGVMLGVTDGGALRLRTLDGEHALLAGTLRRLA